MLQQLGERRDETCAIRRCAITEADAPEYHRSTPVCPASMRSQHISISSETCARMRNGNPFGLSLTNFRIVETCMGSVRGQERGEWRVAPAAD
jgi:hypothetical protein